MNCRVMSRKYFDGMAISVIALLLMTCSGLAFADNDEAGGQSGWSFFSSDSKQTNTEKRTNSQNEDREHQNTQGKNREDRHQDIVELRNDVDQRARKLDATVTSLQETQIRERKSKVSHGGGAKKRGIDVRRLKIDWNERKDGFQYVEYEMKFSPTNTEHAAKVSEQFYKLATDGWVQELTRTVQSTDDLSGVITQTMQVRFRRPSN